MTLRQTGLFNIICAMLGARDVDWNEEPADDGYNDYWGREEIDEPIFWSDFVARSRIHVENGGLSGAKKRA